MASAGVAHTGVFTSIWFSEKSLYDDNLVEPAMQALKERDYAYEDEGALWFRSTMFGDDKDWQLQQAVNFLKNKPVAESKYRGKPRDLDVPGRKGPGVAFALDYLTAATRAVLDGPETLPEALNAKGKHYRYRLCDGGVPDVFARNYVCAWEQHLDVDAMQRAAAHLVGTHDFRAMSSVNKRFKKSTVRTITQITITRKPREICFDVIGTGFLYNMVRILIGTLVEVGEGKRTPDSMPAILDSLDRQQAGVTMPPQGLTLETVLY